jgi:hypothetical protein
MLVIKTEVETATLQYRQGIVTDPRYIVIGPGLLVTVCWRVDQHHQSLGPIE